MSTWHGVDLLSSGLYVAEVSTWDIGSVVPRSTLAASYMRWPWSLVPDYVAALRDANASAGTWPEVVTLEHELVEFRFGDVGRWLEVPMFVGDPERGVWRRRKWWGRGPLVFGPRGRETALLQLDIERVSGLLPALGEMWLAQRGE